MHGDHQLPFVLLSIFIAIFGSWVALELHRQVISSRTLLRPYWLVTTSVAMGVSIFSMHFIAMLGFDAGIPIKYDVGLTVASLLLACLGTSTAFASLQKEGPSKRRLLGAAVAMGSAICLMHYVGMAAIRAPANVSYDPVLVTASYVIAVTVSLVGLFAFIRRPKLSLRIVGSIVLGFAISSMHYTAMAAATFSPTGGLAQTSVGINQLELALWVGVGTVLLLLLAFIAALFERVFSTNELALASGDPTSVAKI